MNNRNPLLFVGRQRKNHPWIRLDESGSNSAMHLHQHQEQQQLQRVPSRRSKMRLAVDTTLSNGNGIPEDHPEEPGAIPTRRTTSERTSPRNAGTTGTTFQQYRQQRSVRKHPWRTDVKGRGSKRGAKSWRGLVKSASPWDEFPSIIEEEEEWITRSESKESEGSVEVSIAGGEAGTTKEARGKKGSPQKGASPEQSIGLLTSDQISLLEETEEEAPKNDLLEDLRARVRKVYQGDHYIVSGVGTGEGKRPVPEFCQREKAVRQQLVRALHERLQNYYTGHLPSYEAYGKQGAAPAPEEEKAEESEGEEESDEGSTVSMDESVVSVQSMIVAATILNSKRAPVRTESRSSMANAPQAEEQHVQQKASEESEWEEYTVYDDETAQAPQEDDDDEWEEETVATEALSRSQQIRLMQSSAPQMGAQHADDDDDDDEWDEYTVETSALPQHEVPVKDPSLLSQVLSSPRPHAGATANHHPMEQSTAMDDDEYEWDEYTVETIADALLALPNALQMHRPVEPPPSAPLTRTDSGNLRSPSSIAETVKNIVDQSNSRLAAQFEHDVESVSYYDEIIEDEYDDDDDHWDDYTVETVADAFASLPRTLQLEFLRTTTSTRNIPRQQEVQDDDESSEGSSLPPEGAYPEENAPRGRSDHDEWTEVTCEETIHDIPGILRQADSAKSTTRPTRNSGTKPIVTDPTLSSTDSESETWHDARSSGSGDVVREISSTGSTGSRSRGSMLRHRRTRSPPTNLNQVLKEDIFSQDLEVVEGALQSLAQKADDDLEYRAHIVRSGGILAIVRAMQQNVYKAKIQVLACKTLGKIATDRENRVAIGEVGGVEAVVGAMSEHMADEIVAEATCLALWLLTTDCPSNQLSIEAAALDVVVSCMRRYAKNPTIQEKAFQTLANLCLENEEKLVALSQIGGFVVMSTALVIHWENAKVKNEAISTLAQLFARLAESQTA